MLCRYNQMVHKAWHKAGYAPALYAFRPLPGGVVHGGDGVPGGRCVMEHANLTVHGSYTVYPYLNPSSTLAAPYLNST